jgi:Bacterial RNA polymerase, alpha chain C terminal domain/Sigma-70, region 4
MPIRELGLSRRANNALLSSGVRTVGALDRKSFEDILGLRNIGVKTAKEIFEVASRISRTEDAVDDKPTSASPQEDVPPAQNAARGIPRQFWNWPIAILGLSSRLHVVLTRAGIRSLGNLNAVARPDVTAIKGMGVAGEREVYAALESLVKTPGLERMSLLSASDNGVPPTLPLPVLNALLAGTSVESEVDALLSDVPPRNADVFRQRWSRVSGRQPTLEEIARSHGITRERVRQLVEKQQQLLQRSDLRAPISSQIVQHLQDAGGALPTPQLLAVLRQHDLNVTPASLGLVQSLSEVGVTPQRFGYYRAWRLWLTDDGVKGWVDSGKLDAVVRDLRRDVPRELHEIGVISTIRLKVASPFGVTWAASMAISRRVHLVRVGDYLVPNPTGRSALRRAILKMLVVSPELALSDIQAGLSQRPEFRPVPSDVLVAVIKGERNARISGDKVSLQSRVGAPAVLNNSDRVAIAAMEQGGGLMLWFEFVTAIEQHGLSRPMATALLRQPYIVKRGTAIYGLRGRPVSPAALHQKKQARRQARVDSVLGARWVSADQFEVRYRLTNFTVQGTLALPAELGRVTTTHWSGRLPDGEEIPLRAGHGFLWSLHAWFAAVDARPGDILVATFYIAESKIEFNEVIPEAEIR